jgi:hypothetical protein
VLLASSPGGLRRPAAGRVRPQGRARNNGCPAKASALENQNQYQEANSVLIDALRRAKGSFAPPPHRTTRTRSTPKPSRWSPIPKFLKMERAQILIYLHLERADLAWAVYKDILSGNPGDSVVYDTLKDKDPLIRTGGVRVLGLSGKPGRDPGPDRRNEG